MGATVTTANSEGKTWGGGNEPMGINYGKMMMWFFIISDALTFSGFLAAYGFSRYKFIETWPLADEVFNHFSIYARRECSDVLCGINDIYFDFLFCYYGFGC